MMSRRTRQAYPTSPIIGASAALIVLSALLHLYIGARLAPSLLGHPGGALASMALLLLGFLAASASVIPAGMMFRRRPGRGYQTLHWASLIAMGLFSSLIVLTLLRDALLLVSMIAAAIAPRVVGLDRVSAISAMAVPLVALF